MRDVGILGGGVSGLFTAYFLGGDVEVLEADSTTGGLVPLLRRRGVPLGHRRPHPLLEGQGGAAHEIAILGDNVQHGLRANKILYKGLHVKYPFENGIDILPKEDIVDILHSFIDNPHKAKPTNFREWMYHVFGDGLTDRYLLPYNDEDLEDPGRGDEPRVGRPGARARRSSTSIKTAVGIQTEGYTHQLHFHYPQQRGLRVAARTRSRRGSASKVTTGFRVAVAPPVRRRAGP